MVNWPVVTTLATPEPEIVPIRPDEMTDTLAGAAARVADEAQRDVGEELDHAGPLQERAEQDEQEDVGDDT
jgi:hypothetical protein